MQNELVMLPLSLAVLCANCNFVTNSKGDRCLVCGSPSLLSLSILDAPAKELVKPSLRYATA